VARTGFLVKTAALSPAVLVAAGLIQPASAAAEDAVTPVETAIVPNCDDNGRCHFRMTPQQLMERAESLIHAEKYEAAAPLVEALGQVPELKMQQQFLAGYIAVETGDLKGAIKMFRSILVENPGQTRVRLELARAYAKDVVSQDGESRMYNYNQHMTVQELVDIVMYLQPKYDVVAPQYRYRIYPTP